MSVGYNPQVNDYVVWTTELGQVHKGWVYFVADKAEQKKVGKRLRDISLSRLLLNLAPNVTYLHFLHKRIHVCLCCYDKIGMN